MKVFNNVLQQNPFRIVNIHRSCHRQRNCEVNRRPSFFHMRTMYSTTLGKHF